MTYTLNIKYNFADHSICYAFVSLQSFGECWDRCYEVANTMPDRPHTIEVINYSILN